MKLKTIIFGLLLSGSSFSIGIMWSKHQLLNKGALELNESLSLQISPENIGILPKGSILYPYKYHGEIATFIMFVNTNRLNSLDPISFEHKFTVSPIDAYK